MTRTVPFLNKDTIVHDALALLADYEQARGVRLVPPIPIEDIIEKHLKLTLEFDDMHARHGIARPASGETDILGAIYEDGSIFIDESLDPEENPSKEGRYRFTLAHEGGGHWRLHQSLIVQNRAQIPLFDDAPSANFLCRSSEAKRPEEWQADFYASCLLMPARMVVDVWDSIYPGWRPYVMDRSRSIEILAIKDSEEREFEVGVEEWQNEQRMDDVARPLALRFLVSPIAMRIRLEGLGLLLRDFPNQRSLAG